MRMRYEAMIDGIPLSSIDPSIYITDIQESAPTIRRTTANYPTLDGQRVLGALRQSLRVAITFEIHNADIRRRADICERVRAWTKGTFLETNARPDQRLRVALDQAPVVTSALRWTDALTVALSAYAVPFWEDAYETRIDIPAGGAASAYVPGTADRALCWATVENAGDTPVTAVELRAGDSSMTFSGISIPKGGSLALAYADGRLLSAKIGGASVLAGRTPESDDDLLVPCDATVEFSARATGSSAKTAFFVRGWYL